MKALLALIGLVAITDATFRDQSIGAKGYITCRGVRQAGVFVQLFDEDTLSFLDSDDLMGSTTADINGHFCVKGTTSEFTDIDPYILIEHNCGYEGLDQKTTFFYYLNKEHIVEGTVAESIEHLGHIELLTGDAPVQEYSRRQHLLRTVHRTQHERIQECLPLYVTYRDFYEKEVFGESLVVSRKELESEGELPEITVEEAPKQEEVEEKKEIEQIHGEVVHVEQSEAETSLRIEEERVKLETLKVEEERLHLERTKEEEKLLEEERQREEELRVDEERRREVDRKREEERLKEEERRKEEEKRREEERAQEDERRRQEEQRREEERKQREEERKAEEERARLAYEKAMEEYRKREEARQLEIKRREEAAKTVVQSHTIIKEVERTEEGGKVVTQEEYDPCAYRLKRHITGRYDPCNSRKLRG